MQLRYQTAIAIPQHEMGIWEVFKDARHKMRLSMHAALTEAVKDWLRKHGETVPPDAIETTTMQPSLTEATR